MKKNALENLCDIADYICPRSHLLLGLDFDGTLTPIQNTPSSVFMDNKIRDLLDDLSKKGNITVAVISGRSLDDLIEKIGLGDIVYVGNHGLDIRGPGLRKIDVKALQKQRVVEKAFGLCQALLSKFPGIFMEDKILSFAIHYRNLEPVRVPDLHFALKVIVSELGDLVIKTGKSLFEIYPHVETNKFTAFSWVASQTGNDSNTGKMYLGDDDTDEDVFSSLKDGIGIRIGLEDASNARFFLKDPLEVEEFLAWLNQRNSGFSPIAGKFWSFYF